MLRWLGMALVVFGLLWSFQGFGMVTWPPNSFMLGQREWGLIGAACAAVGAVLVWLSRRGKPSA
jgi:uncharacterized protein YjeT (DUF2065 family)